MYEANDRVYALISQYSSQSKADPTLVSALYEIEKHLSQKVDRVEFSQILQTKADVNCQQTLTQDSLDASKLKLTSVQEIQYELNDMQDRIDRYSKEIQGMVKCVDSGLTKITDTVNTKLL